MFSVATYVIGLQFNPRFADIANSLQQTLGTMTTIGSRYEPMAFGS
jgi:hypothetical protein